MTLRVLILALLAASVSAAPAVAKDRIAFVAGGDIHLIAADGSGLKNLTQTPVVGEGRPMWSPDARRIAYQRLTAGGRFEAWVMNADGTSQAPLITSANRHVLGPSWSPDGRRIAYGLYDSQAGTGQIVASDLDGTHVTPLAPGVVHEFSVAWSPRGDQILYSLQALGLELAQADGSGNTTLLNAGTQNATQAKWSPDGKRVVYMGCPEFSLCGNNDIWVMNSDGTGSTRLTTNEGGDVTPAFSADGKRIAYARFESGIGFTLHLMDDTGSDDAPAPGVPAGAVSPDWEPLGDEDGDALFDVWETDGIDTDGDGMIDLDLPAMGADPKAKDIFLEIDYAAPHELEQAAVNKVMTAFAIAPVTNPDGSTGIALHIDNGPSSIMNPRDGTLWGSRSRHDDIPHAAVTGSVTSSRYDWSAFDTHKSLHFDPERAPAFHYAISTHGHSGTSSGIARDIPSSDLLLTLGAGCEATNGSDCTLDADAQAGTLMHELGHNLGLRHGGDDDLPLNKPSYLSVMNYAFQLTGLFRADLTREFDYARSGLSLNEAALDEAVGLGAPAGSAAAGFNTLARCPGGAQVMWPVLGGPLDFNCDGTTGGVVASDTNADGATGTLEASADWPRIVFKGGGIGARGVAVLPAESEVIEPPLAELLESRRTAAAYVPVPRVLTPIAPGTPALPSPALPAAVAQARRPAVSALRVRPSAFAVARRGRGDRRRLGTTVHYSIAEAGTTRFTVERSLAGRRAAGRCLPARRAPKGRACRRTVRVAGRLSHVGRGGTNQFVFSGRVGGRALAPGRYLLVGTALAGDGRAGPERRAPFRVLR